MRNVNGLKNALRFKDGLWNILIRGKMKEEVGVRKSTSIGYDTNSDIE